MSLERIIITFNEDGSLRGIASYDKGELPKPLRIQDLAAIAGTIDTAALVSASEKEAAEAKLAELTSAKTPEELAEKIEQSKRTEKQREIARLEKEIAEKVARKSELESAEIQHGNAPIKAKAKA